MCTNVQNEEQCWVNFTVPKSNTIHHIWFEKKDVVIFPACPINYLMKYPARHHHLLPYNPEWTLQSDCQALCSNNPSCTSYQLDKNPNPSAYCWLQVSMNTAQLKDNLYDRQNIEEYVKSSSCRTGIVCHLWRRQPTNVGSSSYYFSLLVSSRKLQYISNQIKNLYCIDIDQNKKKPRKIYKTKLLNFKIRIYNVIL